MKRGSVKEFIHFGSGSQYDTPFTMYIDELNSIVAKIPEDLRGSAYINIQEDREGIELAVYYYRPETDEEMNNRAAKDADETARKEHAERQAYEQLKRKFEKDLPTE